MIIILHIARNDLLLVVDATMLFFLRFIDRLLRMMMIQRLTHNNLRVCIPHLLLLLLTVDVWVGLVAWIYGRVALLCPRLLTNLLESVVVMVL